MFIGSSTRLDLKFKKVLPLSTIEEWVQFGHVEIIVLPVRSL